MTFTVRNALVSGLACLAAGVGCVSVGHAAKSNRPTTANIIMRSMLMSNSRHACGEQEMEVGLQYKDKRDPERPGYSALQSWPAWLDANSLRQAVDARFAVCSDKSADVLWPFNILAEYDVTGNMLILKNDLPDAQKRRIFKAAFKAWQELQEDPEQETKPVKFSVNRHGGNAGFKIVYHKVEPQREAVDMHTINRVARAMSEPQ